MNEKKNACTRSIIRSSPLRDNIPTVTFEKLTDNTIERSAISSI